MKLTEQQLAHMFKQSKDTEIDSNVGSLHSATDASDQRLRDVESIVDNSALSASYQIINHLQDWSQAIGTDIQLSLKPHFTSSLLNWLKPSLATAALITTVYFVMPQLDNSTVDTLQKPDRIMFTSSFEDKSDIIKDLSFDGKTATIKSDSISKANFG